MFELLGVFDLAASASPITIPHGALPTLLWADASQARQASVGGGRLRADYLERTSETPSYARQGDLHLFVVGEPFAGSAWPPSQSRPVGPVSARQALELYKHGLDGLMRGIKGNYTLVIADEAGGESVLISGRFGVSPFYYALDGRRFIFSTSLAAVGECLATGPRLDHTAVAELALFNYPLGDRTYFQEAKMVRPAEVVRASAAGLRQTHWWDTRTLYDARVCAEHEAIEEGGELFHRTVNQLACDVPRTRMSITSGFNDRAILSVLDKQHSDVLGYAFGTPGSLNVTIPYEMCSRFGVPFQPIYLGNDYERHFDDYALRAIILSDCLSTAERANYPYAFEKLVDFSPVVLTGLFGSELMRTFQNVGDIVSANLVAVNLAADPRAELRRLTARPEACGYFAPELFGRVVDEVEADLASVLIDKFGDLSADRRFYMFLLTEGLRKYFGAEVHMERPWGTNRFPFLDDDFVAFAFRAPFAGVYSRTLRPTLRNRFRSQRFYAAVIRRYRPELLRAPTDHGYAPGDVLSPFGVLNVGPKFLISRWRRKRARHREFRTEEWTDGFYGRHLFRQALRTDVLSPRLGAAYGSGRWKTRRVEFAKAAALQLWLHTQERAA